MPSSTRPGQLAFGQYRIASPAGRLVPDDDAVTAATVAYPTAFTCAIARANIFAVQFHPEKSHRAGLQLLANFVAWNGRV